MPKKPALLLRVTDVESVTVSGDPLEGAIIRFSLSDDTNDLESIFPRWRSSACKPCYKRPTASRPT